MKKYFLAVIILIQSLFSVSQDIEYARHIIDTLSSPSFDGRGYVNGGDKRASEFIAGQFRRFNLKTFSKNYFQYYSFPMNTLPGKLEAKLNGKPLIAGEQFQVWAATPTLKGTYKVVVLKGKDITNPKRFARITTRDFNGKFVLIDKKGITDKIILAKLDSLRFTNFIRSKGLIYVSDQKLTWSVMVGYRPRSYAVLDIRREALPKKPHFIDLTIESVFEPDHSARNVIGYVQGKTEPDSFLVFTAHYDHLGRMGNAVYYPGANDNASGTSMVLDLARHYSLPENQPYYSIIFICLSGEEAGLKGSTFCAEHPTFPLKKVKFLMNIDMVGTGSEGITMVNATIYKDAFQRMVKINADNEYLLAVKERGESCNSDHCPFFKQGVPAVFIYSMGKEFTEYHNPDDKSSKLPLSEYKDIFRLVRDFMDSESAWR
jgi:aminopeptidase YwaD